MYITQQDNPRLDYLRQKTSRLTSSPGCYIMKDKSEKIIYIGKAKNLKNRVTSYFRKGQDHLPKVWKMVSNVYDYDFIVTDSEFEALVLECSLIKLHTPKYNILLKDDKGYSYIKITNEEYPKLQAVLQKTDDNGKYIGPYTSSFAVKQAVEEANKVFMLPTCSKVFPRDIKKERPCLNYHIKRCCGVCTGAISKEEYVENVNQAVEYIKNGCAQSIEQLTLQMKKAADNLDFELAAKLRDRINAISKASENQKIIDQTIPDCDIIAMSENVETACAGVLMYRGGRLVDKADYFLGEKEDSKKMLEEFIISFYSLRKEIPPNIFLREPVEDNELLEKYLRQKYGKKVHISVPQKGKIFSLTALAKSNANEYLSIKVGRTGKEVAALEELAKALGMSKPPKYIECYDISNLASTNMVAGMVVFENARPCKKYYKRFSIKTVAGQNDYACMQEVIERRFKNYFEKTDEGFSIMPDLILVDGGKGHVNAAEQVLTKMGIKTPLFGLVKDDKHKTRGVCTGDSEISLIKSRNAFNLVTAIQDEVHRFSITYQRSKRSKNAFMPELTSVKGIGEKKAMKILESFKTKDQLKNASVQQLKDAAGINIQTAVELKKLIDQMK